MPTVFSKEIASPLDTSSSSSSSANNQKKDNNISKKSIGNQFKFAQQSSSKKVKPKDPDEIFAHSELYQDVIIEQAIDKLSSCCPKGTRFGFGCLLTIFRTNGKISEEVCFSADSYMEDYLDCSQRALKYVKECRKLGVSDNPQISKKENRDGFLQEVYRECLIDVKELSGGTSKHIMRYCIPAINQKLGRLHKPEVCLPTLLGVYGFTEYEWRICTAAVKSNPTGRVASLRHKVWKDDKLPEHSFAEMQKVFEDNLSVSKAGERVYLLFMKNEFNI
jgi:hypothetical protein